MTLQSIQSISLLTLVLIQSACGIRGHESNEHLNRLAKASSPYLKEHSDNPVDWYEWGVEPLEKAKKEGKPLLVSVGYASCHWCHVMERESFMDTAVARFMNENFVSIKVDREERPDVDQIYINAAQLISGSAGWPLNAFALPDGKPFYAATYFPKDQWLKILNQIVKAYKEDTDNVLKQAEALTKGIQDYDLITPVVENQNKIDTGNYKNIFASWQSQLDYESGGLAGAPKFPMPVVWEYVLQNHYLTGSEKSIEAVTTTLNAMEAGGIYDHLGGGFARYSTDVDWKVPHFEKMLYDNGQLVSLYSHAYQQTKNSRHKEVVEETLEFIKRELTSPEGGFYSSINADSEDEEGKFYVWTKTEIEKLLDKETFNLFVDYYNITDSGNWEDQKNILYRNSANDDIARKDSAPAAQIDEVLKQAKQILMKERNKRIHPSLDDKILTSWNALMLNGYVDAYLATGKSEYLEVALKNASFLEKNVIRKEGQLWRSYKDGKASIDAFLDDYALLAKAYIHLYEATFDIHWLAQSHIIATYAILHFQNKQNGLFYYTSDESESLIARKMELNDNVIPSSNSIMADVLFRLGTYYDNDSYREMSKTMLTQVTTDITKNGPYYANWASLMGMIAYEPYEVAIMGKGAIEKAMQMQRNYLPNVMFMGGIEENLPLLENKNVKEETIIYVCRNKVCKAPVKDIRSAMNQINE